MQLFYIKHPTSKLVLSGQEAKHITRVLRKDKKDILSFTDGKGNLYKGKIININNKECSIEILNSQKQNKKHNYYLHIAIAPTKNIDRFEWFLEKSTEIGIDEITPIICDHSERKIIKSERCEKILISAMKQSLKYYLPKLNNTITFNEFINKEESNLKYIAHCQKIQKTELKNLKNTKNTTILIGPEGDFSNNEISKALENKFTPISLGNNRLRTETAGLIAVNMIHIQN